MGLVALQSRSIGISPGQLILIYTYLYSVGTVRRYTFLAKSFGKNWLPALQSGRDPKNPPLKNSFPAKYEMTRKKREKKAVCCVIFRVFSVFRGLHSRAESHQNR
ncbi:MAG: hypothetical protein C5B50_03265 [Verrucomicrobia bacterium]|nr:MAG: hypothetical protein C5B50_03265 [Verrucomicrobiota bacterium]